MVSTRALLHVETERETARDAARGGECESGREGDASFRLPLPRSLSPPLGCPWRAMY